MSASRIGPLMVALLVAALVRPAASGDCREEDLDAEGKCPRKQPPPPVKPTQLDIRGADAAGVQVSIDSHPAGRAPLVLPTKPGRHLVEVKRDGYKPYAEWVEVKPGERRLVQVKLQPAPPPPAEKVGTCPEGMVRVPAGTFQMGLPGPEYRGHRDEHPQHEVTLSAYCIDRTEVTVNAYAACVAAKRCSAAPPIRGEPCNQGDRPDHPINCVDWSQAAAYCKWARKRLPTEAEWEYAARGTDGRRYPWGNEAPSATRLNACGSECVAMFKRDLHADMSSGMYSGNDGWEQTAPVGSFPAGASPFGALNMAGNVWEWTADWYGDYPATATIDPRGPTTGTGRVYRGGDRMMSAADGVSTTIRAMSGPTRREAFLGFRCARGDRE